MNDAKFSNWRLSYINYITDVNIFYKKLFNLQYLDDFFPSYNSKDMIVNTMQIAYNLWHELLKDKSNEKLKEQFFLYFFVGSCFIVLKVRNISI